MVQVGVAALVEVTAACVALIHELPHAGKLLLGRNQLCPALTHVLETPHPVSFLVHMDCPLVQLQRVSQRKSSVIYYTNTILR